jgi:hypothetical protein
MNQRGGRLPSATHVKWIVGDITHYAVGRPTKRSLISWLVSVKTRAASGAANGGLPLHRDARPVSALRAAGVPAIGDFL